MPNPAYESLLAEIKALEEKLEKCAEISETLSRWYIDVQNTLEKLKFIQKYFEELREELSSVVKSVENDISNATTKLTNIKGAVGEYMSEKIVQAPKWSRGDSPLLSNGDFDQKNQNKIEVDRDDNKTPGNKNNADKSNALFAIDKAEYINTSKDDQELLDSINFLSNPDGLNDNAINDIVDQFDFYKNSGGFSDKSNETQIAADLLVKQFDQMQQCSDVLKEQNKKIDIQLKEYQNQINICKDNKQIEKLSEKYGVLVEQQNNNNYKIQYIEGVMVKNKEQYASAQQILKDTDFSCSFYGVNNKGIASSFDGCITERRIIEGGCAVYAPSAKINQQFGGNVISSESQAVDKFMSINHINENNVEHKDGIMRLGSTFDQRTKYLEGHGLSNEKILGYYDQDGKRVGQGFSLEQIAVILKDGGSCDLNLNCEDLTKEKIKTSKIKSANHTVSVTGACSVNNEVVAITCNDTSMDSNGNRIIISKDRFEDMLQSTKGFSLEVSKKDDEIIFKNQCNEKFKNDNFERNGFVYKMVKLSDLPEPEFDKLESDNGKDRGGLGNSLSGVEPMLQEYLNGKDLDKLDNDEKFHQAYRSVFYDPITYNIITGCLEAGRHRVQLAKKLGIKYLPVIFKD